MKIKNVIKARQEAERFLRKLARYEETDHFKNDSTCSANKDAAALKRSSMDLSRALSDLRRG